MVFPSGLDIRTKPLEDKEGRCMTPYVLIANWQDKHYYCALCGTDKSVKYQIGFQNDLLPVCNKCVLKHIEYLNQRAIAENDKTRFSL